jgi:hypothetical protein
MFFSKIYNIAKGYKDPIFTQIFNKIEKYSSTFKEFLVF